MDVENFTSVVVIPVVLGVFRLLFETELQYLIALIFNFVWRPYDIDRNLKTMDWCMLHNGASGEWSFVSLSYCFFPFVGTSGVYIHRYDKADWTLLHVERVRFADFVRMRKAAIVKIPTELKKIIENKDPNPIEC